MDELARKVSLIKGVSSKLIDLKIPKDKKPVKTAALKKAE
jgi:hypothetical protein